MVATRILIARLSAIGDCILTLPMVQALKKQWPDAEITWVVDCGVDTVLKTQPNVQDVIRIRKGFLKRPSELWSLRSRLQSYHFDICIDPQGLMKSSLLGWLSDARFRIGFSKGQSREQAWRFYHQAVSPQSSHLVDRQLELLKPLGIDAREASFGWFEPDSVAAQSNDVLREIGLGNEPFYVVNPGAGWASKRWSDDRYRELIRKVYEAHGYRCLVVWGDETESRMAHRITSGNEAALLAPPTSLMLLSGLIQRSRFFVGSDTGPMHLAAAVGTPCIAMFGTTRAGHSGPYGRQHVLIQKMYEAGSSKHRRSTTNHAMMQIETLDVLQAVKQILSAPRNASRGALHAA